MLLLFCVIHVFWHQKSLVNFMIFWKIFLVSAPFFICLYNYFLCFYHCRNPQKVSPRKQISLLLHIVYIKKIKKKSTVRRCIIQRTNRAFSVSKIFGSF